MEIKRTIQNSKRTPACSASWYRAVNEISIQKGAELLDLTFDELVPYCSFGKER